MKKIFCTLGLIIGIMGFNLQSCYADMYSDFIKINESLGKNISYAETLSKGFVSKYPKVSDGYATLAIINAENDNMDKALYFYDKALSIDNIEYVQKYEVFLRRAVIYWDYKNDLKKALQDYDNAIKSAPANSVKLHIAYAQRGEIKTLLNSPVGAQEDLEKALTYNSINADKELHARTLAFLSKSLYMQKKYKEAIKQAGEALVICGIGDSYASVTAQVYIAKSALANKEYDLAKSMAELAKSMMEMNGNQSDSYYKEMLNILNQVKGK